MLPELREAELVNRATPSTQMTAAPPLPLGGWEAEGAPGARVSTATRTKYPTPLRSAETEPQRAVAEGGNRGTNQQMRPHLLEHFLSLSCV